VEPQEMKRLYLEHREVEEARDLDAVVATFGEECFLENVALASRAVGREEVRRSYEALFSAFPDLSPDSEGEAFGEDVFVTWEQCMGRWRGPGWAFPDREKLSLPLRQRGPVPAREDAGRATLLRSGRALRRGKSRRPGGPRCRRQES
jgi:hypothetical protein